MCLSYHDEQKIRYVKLSILKQKIISLPVSRRKISNMAPKLYGFTASVPFRAVLMCARQLNLELEIIEINLAKGEHVTDEFIKKNPQHTIPVLDDDGFVLPDSHAINGYLVQKYGKANDPLYPIQDIKRKATIDHRLHFDSSIIAAAGILITKPLVMENQKPDQKGLDRLREAFGILDKLLEIQNTRYIVGDQLSIADFNMVSTVSSWKCFVKDWEKSFPHVRLYLERLSQEDFYKANTDGLQAFNDFVNIFMK